jgi:hypothetical protein
VTKCLQKKLKLKNERKWDLANLENSFLILTFWGGILDFLIPYMTYFKKKKFHHSEELILKFINTKIEKR